MYAKYFKRLIDFSSSLIVLIILSPLLVLLIILGAVFMKGNPFLHRIVREKMKRFLN